MTVTIEEIVDHIDDLVSLPGVFIRINEMIESQESTTSEISGVLSQGPGLTVRFCALPIARSEETDAPPTHPGSGETVGLTTEVIQPVITAARQEFENMRALFLPEAKKAS